MQDTDKFQTEYKNYYNSTKKRRFTILNLEVRPLTFWDYFILALFTTVVGAHFFITYRNPQWRLPGLASVSLAAYALTTATPFGLRFRNVYFFAVWLVLCLIFLFAGTSLAFLPLASFVLYQAIRLLFWQKYNKEFIPFQLVRAPLTFSKKAFLLNFDRVISKTEGRGGYQEDKRYMRWMVRLGFLIFIICLYGIVGVRFD